MLKGLAAYVLILVTALIPVIVLYVLFEQLNLFTVDDKFIPGIAAAGPIAAYLVLIIVGFKLYERVHRMHNAGKDAEALARLLGEWTFKSDSQRSGKAFTGSCSFKISDGSVHATGQVSLEGKPVGTWSSLAITCSRDVYYIMYEMTAFDQGKETRTQGVNKVVPSGNSFQGSWTVLGQEPHYGTIVYERPGTALPRSSGAAIEAKPAGASATHPAGGSPGRG
ncbi:MAG: hypothetical protein SFZ23_04795 [Planctomycetota bacterium]|nr:hypothetical protein [Planctomycetota bacterium]